MCEREKRCNCVNPCKVWMKTTFLCIYTLHKHVKILPVHKRERGNSAGLLPLDLHLLNVSQSACLSWLETRLMIIDLHLVICLPLLLPSSCVPPWWQCASTIKLPQCVVCVSSTLLTHIFSIYSAWGLTLFPLLPPSVHRFERERKLHYTVTPYTLKTCLSLLYIHYRSMTLGSASRRPPKLSPLLSILTILLLFQYLKN